MNSKTIAGLVIIVAIALVISGALLYPYFIEYSGSAQTPGFHEVMDISGNSVVLPRNISRIVTIDPFSSQFVYIIGGTDQLVGRCVGPSDKKRLKKDLPTLAAIPSAGCKGVDLETLISLNPEVAVSSIVYNKTNDKIRTTSIPVFLIDLEDPDNLMKSYQMLGEILGRQKETEEFISYYHEKMDLLQNDTAKMNQSEKKRIYLAQGSPLSTVGTGWYQNKLVEYAGGINVASDLVGGSNKISIEQLYVWNPDIIILFPYGSKTVNDVLSDPEYAKLKAVQNKQVYRLPGYIMGWDMPVPESVLAGLWMGTIFHPEEVSYDLPEELHDFYARFYHLNLNQSEIDDILDYSSNTSSITKCGGM